MSLEPPEPDATDRARTLAKIVVAGVPAVGGVAAELLEAIVPSSLGRRRERFLEMFADRLEALEAQGIDVRARFEDEAFITLVVQATKAALGTHLEDKLRLIVGCLESAALPERLDDFMAMQMLRWVDELSPEHFVVLLYCSDPPGWFDRHELERRNIMGPRQAILEAAGLSVTGDARALVLKDLNDRRLIDGGMLGGMVSASSAYDPVIKDLGRELLAFVRCFDTTHPDSQSSASPQ